MHRTAAGILAAVAGLLFGNAASAQRVGASIDLGALALRYTDSEDAKAIALSPAAWFQSPSSSLAATGTLSQFLNGGWSLQGEADGSLFTHRYSLFLGEIEGTAGGSTHTGGERTGQLLGVARAHIANDYRGMWIGGGAGSAYDGLSWRNVLQGEAAAWARFNAATAFVSVTPVSIADSVKYTDAQLSGSLNLAAVELVATGGFRSGGSSKSWGSASITAWIASYLAIVGSAGTYPIDLTQGFPGGRFASLALRVGSRRYPPAASSVREIGGLDAVSRTSYRFESRDLGGGIRELRLNAPGAASVEVMGDFSDWNAVRLENAGGGWWSHSFRLEPGIHELNVRIDGGPWVIPPGLHARADEFGGSVGVLVIR